MYWKVLSDAAGYTAGDILDLGDDEAVARVAAAVPLVQVGRPEPVAPESVAPIPVVVAPKPQSIAHVPEPAKPRSDKAVK